jgi:3-deoxy-7-phosphoheptulonate synthase
MIIILKRGANPSDIEQLRKDLTSRGFTLHESIGTTESIIGVVGDTSALDENSISARNCVEIVKRIAEPYKKANRRMHPENSVIAAGKERFGDGSLQIIAGPCSVETEEQILTTAKAVKAAGATMLRGGAFKPRTSPYAFQGLEADGIELLKKARAETGLPIVTEIMGDDDLPLFDDIDVIQVGARNMQNFKLLKALGKTQKPILLKRGLSNTIEELLMSAEYIMAGGNNNVILCERGIRTFETMTRNTLDISAVSLLKQKTHLPVCADPSHATGIISLIEPMSLSLMVAGADALEIEVHCEPTKALSDGGQQLTPAAFTDLMGNIKKMADFLGKPIGSK